MISFRDWDKLENNNLGYSDKTHWFKFNLNEKNIDSHLKYFLVSQNNKLEEIDLFIVKDKIIISQFQSGLKRGIKNQEIKSRRNIFPIPNETNIEIYIKVKNSFYPLNMDFDIYSNYTLDNFIDIDNFINLIYYLLLIILLIMHFFVFKITKIYFYKYYLMYLSLLIIIGLFNSGIFNIFFGLNEISIILLRFLGFLMIFSLIRLLIFILDLDKNYPKLNKIINILLYFVPINLIISDILSSFNLKSMFFVYLTDFSFLVLLLIISLTLILKSLKKEFISYLLILLWFPIIISMIIYLINNFFTLVDSNIVSHFIKFLFVLESIFISLIIAYKYNLIDKEKEQLIIESKNKEILYLRQSKLIKMGEMLNNIAHQWKQPLARINSIVFKSYDLIEENKKEELKKELLLIENETANMSNTISSLLSFFHIDKKEEEFNLYDLAINQKEFIKRFDNSIDFEINCSDNTISTNGYKKEYEQVIRVILENAIDSFKEFNIQTKKIIITIKKENDIPILSIENIGKNINEEILDKIFEPYFTTKNKNEHQGIGLYMSKMLIEESMNKKLRVSNTNLGVEFIIEG